MVAQSRRLYSLLGNAQRLDGGSMFGNAPRAVWSRWVEVDDEHRIELACRAMLVREGDGRNLLFEAGIGAFFEPKLKARFGVEESEHVLLRSLASRGLSPEEIDVVVLSHLHFDHAGGLLSAWEEGVAPHLLFPRAHYVVSERAWARALQPHMRDRASFIPVLHELLEASGRLVIVRGGQVPEVMGAGYRFHFSEGHTPGLMLTEVELAGGPVVFAGDLIPGMPWVHLPITMGYDRYPERLIDEKATLIADLHARKGRIFYTHDANVAMSGVDRDERGRFVTTAEMPSLEGITD